MQNNINIFCLVSRQAMANVLPVLMLQPRSVTLARTQEENEIANNLEKLFRSKGITINTPIHTDAFHFAEIKEVIHNRLTGLDKTQKIILNVTGGTKPMAFAAYDNFKDMGLSIVYCDTEHKKLLQFFPEYSEQNLDVQLSIEDYFTAYGYKIIEEASAEEINQYDAFFNILSPQILQEFLQFCDTIRKEFDKMNSRTTKNSRGGSFQFQKINDKIYLRSNKIPFTTLTFDSINFITGHWMEFYTYYSLMKKGVSPLKACVKIVNNKGTRNELDIVYLREYKLHILSCKSGKYDNHALYELDTLRKIAGGVYGQAGVIVGLTPPNQFNKRAQELNISIQTVTNI